MDPAHLMRVERGKPDYRSTRFNAWRASSGRGTREAAQPLRRPPMTEPAVLTIEEAARVLRIGRSAAYAAARAGELPVIRVGAVCASRATGSTRCSAMKAARPPVSTSGLAKPTSTVPAQRTKPPRARSARRTQERTPPTVSTPNSTTSERGFAPAMTLEPAGGRPLGALERQRPSRAVPRGGGQEVSAVQRLRQGRPVA